jgi:MFS family permease
VEILRLPGTLKFTSFGFIARLPIAIEGLGIVLFVTGERGSYALAGVLTGLYALAGSVAQPLTGRMADSWGQRIILPILATLQSAFLVVFVLGVNLNWSTGALILISIALGASQPSIGGMVRARWASGVANPAQVRTGFAIESLLDEAIFIIGPPVATFLALSIAGGAPLIASAILVFSGSLLLASQRRTEPKRARREEVRERMPVGPLLVIVLATACLGIVFGALEIAFVAFADEVGQRGMTGILYVAYSLASLFAGLWFGAHHYRATLSTQWRATCAALMVATILLPFAATMPVLLVFSFIAGFAVSPSLIIGLTLVERIMPMSRLTEALTWALSVIGVGMALASAISGALVQDHGARAAFIVCAVGGVLAFLVTAVGQPVLRKAENRAASEAAQGSTAD